MPQKKPNFVLKPKIAGEVYGVLNDLFRRTTMPVGSRAASFESETTPVTADFLMVSAAATATAGGGSGKPRWKPFGLVLRCRANFDSDSLEFSFSPKKGDFSGEIELDGGNQRVESGEEFEVKLKFEDVSFVTAFTWELDFEYPEIVEEVTVEIHEAELWFVPNRW